MSWSTLLFGRPLASDEQSDRKIGAVAALPALGLDGLASSAYGPEAALAVLLPLGAAGVAWLPPVMGAILVLLALLYASYRQTVAAYPTGGGAYTVASQNLGTTAGLVAAAALMIDYVLNVAVGISAGVGALTSAVPGLHAYTLELCLGILALITLTNLRGTREAGLAFALPTYAFLASLGLVLGIGVARAAASGWSPEPVVPPPPLPEPTAVVGPWILLRAFASGCTAMTGVEAVSNGMTVFKDPPVVHGRRTLTAIVVSLGVLLLGVAALCPAYGIGATAQGEPGYQSVLSQITGAVLGRGPAYSVVMASVLAVLCLSANTSFAGFPRLCRAIAADRFLPAGFARPGRRLVFTVGILVLAATAGGLLILFRGITDRLIPLFAVGAFLAFTMSQLGMVAHWWRDEAAGRAGRTLRLAVNGAGAAVTMAALAIIVAAKFVEGAWITITVLPLLVLMLKAIRRYYDRVATEVRDLGVLDLGDRRPPVVVLPVRTWNKLTDKALAFAVKLSPDVYVVHLSQLEGEDARAEDDTLVRRWREVVVRPAKAAGFPAPHLRVVRSPYRKFLAPLLDEIGRVQERFPDRQVAIIVPDMVERRWWYAPLHHQRARRLARVLVRRGDQRLVVVHVPWHLEGGRAG